MELSLTMIYPPVRRDIIIPFRGKNLPLLKAQEEVYVYTVLSSSRYE